MKPSLRIQLYVGFVGYTFGWCCYCSKLKKKNIQARIFRVYDMLLQYRKFVSHSDGENKNANSL